MALDVGHICPSCTRLRGWWLFHISLWLLSTRKRQNRHPGVPNGECGVLGMCVLPSHDKEHKPSGIPQARGSST
eukprot:scaffold18926_cov21-Tisochrysis_lutea.AAC.1